MDLKTKALGRWKLILSLLGIFAICAAAGSWWIQEQLSDRAHSEMQRDLLARATMASLLIDVEMHESLLRPSQIESDTYKELNSRLARVLAADSSLRYIYTLRPTAKGHCFVLDPTPYGDSDRDGIDDKSLLGDPYSEMTNTGRQVLATGQAAVEADLTTDRWGTFLSAYAPLKSNSGKVVGLLGIDVSATTYLAKIQAITKVVWIGSALATAAFFALLIAIVGSSQRLIPQFSVISSFGPRGRVQILYLNLAILVVGALTIGLVANITRVGNSNRLLALTDASRRLDEIDELLSRAAAHDDLSTNSLLLISNELAARGGDFELEIAGQIRDSRSQPTDAIRAALGTLETHRHELRIESAQLTRDSVRSQTAEQVCFVICALLSVAALVFMKMAIDQQQSLSKSARDSRSIRESHRQIVESLPVGLFRYSAGHCVKGNWALESQLGKLPFESLDDAFERSMNPPDWIKLRAVLESHSKNAESLQVLTQFSRSGEEPRHHEIRGVPIFNRTGDLDHLLCFSVDVNELVVANERLERQNERIEQAFQSLQTANELLELNFVETVHSLVKVVEAKDPYTAGHSERVMQYSLMIGNELGLEESEMMTLKLGCLIHDVGKIGIPDEILTKPERLTDDEYDLIKSHARVGEEMLKNIPRFDECLSIVRHHHERLDGSGYPDGLAGDEIGLLVRICSVADAYDAMTSTRAYRMGMHSGEAMRELEEEVKSGKLDGKIVKVFADIIKEQSELALNESTAA